MRRIAFMNQKGGVGKTTSVANLGAALAGLSRRVLVIDSDPQANLTTHLDHELEEREATIYEVLTRRATVAMAVRKTSTPGLDLVPSSIDLSGAEIELVQEMGRETILKTAVDAWFRDLPVDQRYDFLLVDCPPSLGLLSLNALTTVNEVMIPIQTQFFAMKGMSKLNDVIKLVRRRLNPTLIVTAIIPVMADLRTNLTGEVVQEIKRYFGPQVSRTIIRSNVRLAEAPSHGMSIFQYDRNSRGARDYLRLAREILGELPETEEDLDPGRTMSFDELTPAIPAPTTGPAERKAGESPPRAPKGRAAAE